MYCDVEQNAKSQQCGISGHLRYSPKPQVISVRLRPEFVHLPLRYRSYTNQRYLQTRPKFCRGGTL